MKYKGKHNFYILRVSIFRLVQIKYIIINLSAVSHYSSCTDLTFRYNLKSQEKNNTNTNGTDSYLHCQYDLYRLSSIKKQ